MFSAHAGAIKCLASNDRYLVSGGSDEIIKYSHTLSSANLESTISESEETWVPWYNIMLQLQPYNSTPEIIYLALQKMPQYAFGVHETGNAWQL